MRRLPSLFVIICFLCSAPSLSQAETGASHGSPTPGDAEVQPVACNQSLDHIALLGLEFNIEPQSRRLSGIPGRESVLGFKIKAVRPDSVAATSGLQPGDVVFAVISPHYQNVKEHFLYTVDTLPAYLSEFAGEPISLVFIRDPEATEKQAKLIAPQSNCERRIRFLRTLDTHLTWAERTIHALQDTKHAFEKIIKEEFDRQARESASSSLIRSLVDPKLQSLSEATRKDWRVISDRVNAQEDEERALVIQIRDLAQRQAIDTGSLMNRILAVQTKMRPLRQSLAETSDAVTMETEWKQSESEFADLIPTVTDDVEQRKMTAKGIDDLYAKVHYVRVRLAQSRAEAGRIQSRILEHAARQIAEAKREQEERERAAVRAEAEQREREQDAVRAAAVQVEQEKQRVLKADNEIKFRSLLSKHHAEDMSSFTRSIQFFQNPFAYQGKVVFLDGMYIRNIGPNAAIVTTIPIGSLVQWNTTRNLAEEPTPTVRCVVRILGTTVIQQGLTEREIPNVKEVECLK